MHSHPHVLSPHPSRLTVFVGDAAADTAVAKQGYGSMAVSAIYGGPLLPLLIGLGAAFTVQGMSAYPDPYPLGMPL